MSQDLSEEEAAIATLFAVSGASVESSYEYDSTEDYYDSYEDSTETTPNGLYDEEPSTTTTSTKPKSIFGDDEKFKFFFSFDGSTVANVDSGTTEATTIRPEPVTRPFISTDVDSDEYYDDSDEYYDDEYEYYDSDEDYEYYSDEEYEDFSAEATERPRTNGVFQFSTNAPLIKQKEPSTTTENPLSPADEATRDKLQEWRNKWQAEQQRIWDQQKEQLQKLEEQKESQDLQITTRRPSFNFNQETTTEAAPLTEAPEPPRFSIFPSTTTTVKPRKHKKKHRNNQKTIKPSKVSPFTVFNPSADFESLKTADLQITTRRPRFNAFNGVSINEIKPGKLQSAAQQAVPESEVVIKGKDDETDIVMGTFIVDLEPEVATTQAPLAAYGAPIAETTTQSPDSDYYSDEEYYSDEDEDFGIRGTEGMIGSIFGVSAPQETTTTTTTQGPPVTTMRFSPPPQKRPETTTVRIFAPEPTTTTPLPPPAPTESFRTVRPARPRRPNRPLTKSEKLARIQQRLKQLNSNGRWEKRNRKKLGRRVVLRDGQSPFLAAAQARESTSAISSEIPTSEPPLKIVRTSKKVRKLNAARQRRKKFGSRLGQQLL